MRGSITPTFCGVPTACPEFTSGSTWASWLETQRILRINKYALSGFVLYIEKK